MVMREREDWMIFSKSEGKKGIKIDVVSFFLKKNEYTDYPSHTQRNEQIIHNLTMSYLHTLFGAESV